MSEQTRVASGSRGTKGWWLTFGAKLLIYLGVWLLAVLTLELFLEPEARTQSELSPLEQRLIWPLWTPLMVLFGLGHAFSLPRSIPESFSLTVFAAFIVHAVLTLRAKRPFFFAALIGLQLIVLLGAMASFIHLSRLPDGP